MRFLSPKTKVQNYAIPLFDLSEVRSLEHNWRNETEKGEQTAQAGELPVFANNLAPIY
jgi:hypothetical protein